MENLSRTEITNRLGKEPEHWDFFGQVYSTPEVSARMCALTHKLTRTCFTIKPKSGKGRLTISAEAIVLFERWNPDRYVKLHTGLQFLQVHDRAVEDSFTEQAALKRMRESEKKFKAVKHAARGRIDRYRQTIKKGALPEYLQAMKDLLQRPSPYFQSDAARALWFDQNTVAIEKTLFAAPPEQPATPEPVSAFNPVPEIDF
jgi:hypothetical protein